MLCCDISDQFNLPEWKVLRKYIAPTFERYFFLQFRIIYAREVFLMQVKILIVI